MGGGWLVSADIAGLGWRNAFFINVPICLVVLALSRRYVPETRRDTPSRIDCPLRRGLCRLPGTRQQAGR